MTSLALVPEEIAALVREACVLDVQAFKPGNVSVHAPGHGMTAADFLLSAEAVAEPMSKPGLTVGERILLAVKATNAAVRCNTNLGIMLLLAPLVQAALSDAEGTDLRSRLREVLAGLTLQDSASTFEAIRLAKPGGLGASARHDVHGAATVALLEAMREAGMRDRIARQYVSDYGDVFEVGITVADDAYRRWHSEIWAMVAVYLAFLTTFNDTHVERKHGKAVASRVMREAAAAGQMLNEAVDPNAAMPKLRQLDRRWKDAGINPGTCADLAVGSFFAWRLQQKLNDKVHGQIASKTIGHYPRRALG